MIRPCTQGISGKADFACNAQSDELGCPAGTARTNTPH